MRIFERTTDGVSVSVEKVYGTIETSFSVELTTSFTEETMIVREFAEEMPAVQCAQALLELLTE